jgi:dihydrofolate synthase/folylpolyglutamate synthase
MIYSEAIDYLYRQAPMFQQHGAKAYKSGLENTVALDAVFNHPHRAYKTIHVAGTNGKGSTSHLLASVLQCAGYKVGLYTSPHLRDFRERIRVNGAMISEQAVVAFVEAHQALVEELQPSFFEITTALAFRYFAQQQVDVAVIEVGLGGRLDCTNIIAPELAIITNISLDHTDLLGNTLEKIAAEKAGIIKPNTPVVIGETQPESAPIFRNVARAQNAPILFAETELVGNPLPTCALKGIYQVKNSRTVLVALAQLHQKGFDITDAAIEQGFLEVVERTGLQGRWQVLGNKPTIVCDTGHNEGGIRLVVEQLAQQSFERLHIVFGMVSDKKIDHVLALLPKNAVYYFTKAHIPRALDEKILQAQAATFGLSGTSYASVNEALEAAKNNASERDFIFVGGSNFVVAEII